MNVKHRGSGQLRTLEAGDIVAPAFGAPNPKSARPVSLGRVVQVISGKTAPEAIIFWFGTGTGSGWLASDLEIVQTLGERTEVLKMGAARFFSTATRTHQEMRNSETLNRDEQRSVQEIARDLHVRFIDLLRLVRKQLEAARG